MFPFEETTAIIRRKVIDVDKFDGDFIEMTDVYFVSYVARRFAYIFFRLI